MKGIERYTQGQNDAGGSRVEIETHLLHEPDEIFECETRVLEKAEQTEIDGETDHQQTTTHAGILGVVKPATDNPVDDGRDPQQEDEGWVPGRVEEIARGDQIELLDRPGQWQPVE